MGRKAGITFPRRGAVYLVELDPTRGAEIQKTRPALIIQNDHGNRLSRLTIVAPISSGRLTQIEPFKVQIKSGEAGMNNDSHVLLNQIRAVDKSRLIRRLGRVHPATLARVDRAIKFSLGLIEV